MKTLKNIALLLCVVCVLSGCLMPLPAEPSETEPVQTQMQTQPTQTEPVETEPTIPESLPPVIEREPEDDEFVLIADYIPTAQIQLAYATQNNFTGCQIYDFSQAYLRYGTVKKLMEVARELESYGMGLIIWDGFRPVYAQAKLWEKYPDPTFVSHPITGKRAHCRGNTVDISAYDLQTGEPLVMPTGFDDFSPRADRDYSDCPQDAAANARRLEQTMQKHGFNPYHAEWWHFSDQQDYPVAEAFDPAVPREWEVNCNEYISLRNAPGGEVLHKIPKGQTVELVDWEGKYALVRWRGREGYVLSSYISPGDGYISQSLDTVAFTQTYTYDQMLADMRALQMAYPELISLESAGRSEQGRQIMAVRLGDRNAKRHVLLQGAIHGREHATAWVMMAMVDYWLEHGLMGYGDVCYHFIPMSNPDGVTISQSQQLGDAQYEIYRKDLANGDASEDVDYYASRWKANALGVDINRNFPAGWEKIAHRTEPSSQLYQGTAPFCSAEAKALRDYTLKYDFDVTISYHASGSCIYWEYGKKTGVNRESKSLGNAICAVTGYALEGSSGLDGGGYKDWVMDELQIPSLTIEIGCEDAPLSQRELCSILVRNYSVLPAIALWLQT